MKTVCDLLGVARSNIAVRSKTPLAKPLGRPPQPEADLLRSTTSCPILAFSLVSSASRFCVSGVVLPPFALKALL